MEPYWLDGWLGWLAGWLDGRLDLLTSWMAGFFVGPIVPNTWILLVPMKNLEFTIITLKFGASIGKSKFKEIDWDVFSKLLRIIG